MPHTLRQGHSKWNWKLRVLPGQCQLCFSVRYTRIYRKTSEWQQKVKALIVLVTHSLRATQAQRETHLCFTQYALHLERLPPLLPLLIILGIEAVTWHSYMQGERTQKKERKMARIWARTPLLTSSTWLRALGEALILPVIQLVKILQAICLLWVKLRNFPVAWSRVTGTLGCWLGPFTFVNRQVSHGLRERQEHLALDSSHLGPHTTGNRAGRPGLWDEPAVSKQTRGQNEKPQAGDPGHHKGPHPICQQGPVPSQDMLRAPPPCPVTGASV